MTSLQVLQASVMGIGGPHLWDAPSSTSPVTRGWHPPPSLPPQSRSWGSMRGPASVVSSWMAVMNSLPVHSGHRDWAVCLGRR